MAPDQQQVTILLRQWGSGNREALDQLMPLVYDQLRKLASHCLNSERPGHTLQATALVNEAYLRLAGSEVAFNDRVHFFAVAARLLRRILVDHAKANRRKKRGGGAGRVTLDEAVRIGTDAPGGILELHEALERLAARDQRKSDIVELIFFGGLSHDETAEALHISPATLHRDLKLAKAWLSREMTTREMSPQQPARR
jgi:RNA polymerase sigma factor (TIGR02999 family)